MREILFKAKRKKDGKWVEGYYVKNARIYTKLDSVIVTSIDSPYIEFFDFEEIDESTLCQFTGLTDKNNNKIWENDVVKVDNCFDYIVEYDTQNARFMFNAEPLPNKDIGHCGFHLYGKDEINVIGNIFDNPELLKKEV